MKIFTKIKAYYAGMTPAQKARLWTLFVTVLGEIAAVGDKITGCPFLPGWFLNAWPVIFGIDVAALKLISICTNPNAVAQPPVSDSTSQK